MSGVQWLGHTPIDLCLRERRLMMCIVLSSPLTSDERCIVRREERHEFSHILGFPKPFQNTSLLISTSMARIMSGIPVSLEVHTTGIIVVERYAQPISPCGIPAADLRPPFAARQGDSLHDTRNSRRC